MPWDPQVVRTAVHRCERLYVTVSERHVNTDAFVHQCTHAYITEDDGNTPYVYALVNADARKHWNLPKHGNVQPFTPMASCTNHLWFHGCGKNTKIFMLDTYLCVEPSVSKKPLVLSPIVSN